MSAFATVAWKSSNDKCSAKISDWAFYVTIFEVQNLSIHYFGQHLDHILVQFLQNRMVRNLQKINPFAKTWLTIFEKVLTPFFEDVSKT